MQLPSLDFLANMGEPQLFQPPPQTGLVAGALSHIGVPFALIPGFRPLRMDLHLPVNASGPTPVVVYASGGAWRMVTKHHGPWPFLPSHGYAVAVVEYRVSDEALYPAPLHDIKGAVRFLRANAERYNLDPERVAGWGSSAGAYLLSLTGLTAGDPDFEGDVGGNLEWSSSLTTVIDHYGPSDLASMAADTNDLPNVMEQFGTDTSPETLLLGYRPDADPAGAAAASPVSHARADVPFLIMHGDSETRLGHQQSVRLYEALEQAGADVEFHIVPGANHAGPEFFTDDATRSHSTSWIVSSSNATRDWHRALFG